MNPWLIVAAIVFAGLTAAVGYKKGIEHERVTWQARENRQLATANAEVQRLQTEARDREARSAESFNAVSRQYQELLTHATERHLADVRAIHDGTLRLRDARAAPVCPDASGTGPIAASAGRRDGAQGCELSGAVTEDLLQLALDADAIVEQLTACQALVRADRS